MTSRHARTRNSGVQGNGRTPAENHEITVIARASQTRQQELANAAAGRAGRRAKIAAQVIEKNGPLEPDVLERYIDQAIKAQMAKARAARLTARRKASQAAEALAIAEAAERELLDAAL